MERIVDGDLRAASISPYHFITEYCWCYDMRNKPTRTKMRTGINVMGYIGLRMSKPQSIVIEHERMVGATTLSIAMHLWTLLFEANQKILFLVRKKEWANIHHPDSPAKIMNYMIKNLPSNLQHRIYRRQTMFEGANGSTLRVAGLRETWNRGNLWDLVEFDQVWHDNEASRFVIMAQEGCKRLIIINGTEGVNQDFDWYLSKEGISTDRPGGSKGRGTQPFTDTFNLPYLQ